MRQAGRYLPEYKNIRTKFDNFIEFCLNSEYAAEVTLQPIKRFDLDAAIIFSDILVIPFALGQSVKFVENVGPILDVEKINSLKFNENLLKPIYDSINIVRSNLDKEKDLIGFAAAPWTLSCYMIEGKSSKSFDSVKQFAYKRTSEFKEIINTLEEVICLHILNQIEAGANVIQLFDSWAGCIPSNLFDLYIKNPTKRIVEKIKKIYPQIPIIAFPKNIGLSTENYLRDLNIDCLSVDFQTPLSVVKKMTLNNIAIQGNIDPSLLACNKDLLVKELSKNLELMKNNFYVVNLGHGVIPSTPPENVKFLIKYLRENNET